LEKTFLILCKGPRPLTFDGARFAGLPARPVALDELKGILLHPSTSFELRDAAVGDLVARAQFEGRWMVGLAGVLLPGLRRVAWPLCRACPDKSADVESEMLAGFIAAVRAVDPHRARLASHLAWRAQAGAKKLIRAEFAQCERPSFRPGSAAPRQPWGHPDFVLADAVESGVLCAEDAELIGATRLSGEPLMVAAERGAMSYGSARQRRRRAEAVLVAWLTSDDYSPADFVTKGLPAPRSVDADRPRRGRPRDGRSEQRRSSPTTRR
jgi:hypothetical protein